MKIDEKAKADARDLHIGPHTYHWGRNAQDPRYVTMHKGPRRLCQGCRPEKGIRK